MEVFAPRYMPGLALYALLPLSVASWGGVTALLFLSSGPHRHWHIDISYINICGTFYYLCSLLDGASRYLVHWELRESMREADVEVVLQRAREKFPLETPRIISDNGPQFKARQFKLLTHATVYHHRPQQHAYD